MGQRELKQVGPRKEVLGYPANFGGRTHWVHGSHRVHEGMRWLVPVWRAGSTTGVPPQRIAPPYPTVPRCWTDFPGFTTRWRWRAARKAPPVPDQCSGLLCSSCMDFRPWFTRHSQSDAGSAFRKVIFQEQIEVTSVGLRQSVFAHKPGNITVNVVFWQVRIPTPGYHWTRPFRSEIFQN